MGWFSWLKPAASSVETPPDEIWLDESAKLRGIRALVEAVLECGDNTSLVVVVAHFPATLQKLTASLADLTGDDRLAIALAADVGDPLSRQLTLNRQGGTFVVCAERHPLLSHDDALLRSLEQQECAIRLVHHLALDDALLRVFASEWVTDILRRLGMKDDESIRSPMVSRRVRGAQQVIAKKAPSDMDAESAEEWLRVNAPAAFARLIE